MRSSLFLKDAEYYANPMWRRSEESIKIFEEYTLSKYGDILGRLKIEDLTCGRSNCQL